MRHCLPDKERHSLPDSRQNSKPAQSLMILVADSGSTKTQWITETQSIETQGINPVRDSKEHILKIIRTELMPCLHPTDISHIFFYGAGCIEPFISSVRVALAEIFPQTDVEVGSDLLGAARALCQDNEGIACILGTGSNSCLCRDGQIVSNVPPLGFILGDEGSGAVLGKRLICEMTKGSLTHLWDMFQDEYQTGISEIIDRVYRKPQPNRFLASLVPFIVRFRNDAGIGEMLLDEFTRFLTRNVARYDRPDLPVCFVGGISNSFALEIEQACNLCGMKMGRILPRPAEEMLRYHKNRGKHVV